MVCNSTATCVVLRGGLQDILLLLLLALALASREGDGE